MTPPTDIRALRDRDVEIAKRLGWTIKEVKSGIWALYKPDGKLYEGGLTLDRAWHYVPHYSTDIRDAGVLLVHVMGLGWVIWYCESRRLSLRRTGPGSNPVVEGKSILPDPQAAFADAVSQACLRALESEVGDE